MASSDPRLGTVLYGRYQLLERLSAGAMGVVYRAERVKLGRPVAIKFLHESFAATEDGMRRFEVEARAMSRLNHPNCVSVTDFGVDQGAPYLVMDFVTGHSLRQVLVAEGRMEPERVVSVVRQLLAGLAHAHGHGIIHRDVKPENVLLTPVEGHGEQVRILDFGLAKLRDESSVTTGVAVGTPGYMSPEQTAGERVDQRADVYAAGIILHELVVGRKPFVDDSPFEVMRMHREDKPRAMTGAAPGVVVSSELEGVVQRALAKSRDERFGSAAAFLAALVATPEASGRRTTEGWHRTSRPSRVPLAILGLAIAAIIGVTVWSHGHHDRGAAGVSVLANQRPRRADDAPPAAAAADPDTAVAASHSDPPAAAASAPPSTAPAAVAGAEPAAPDAGTAAGAPPAAAPAAPAAADDPPAPAPVAEANDIARIRAHAAAGDRRGALHALQILSQREPRRADLHYTLATFYAEDRTWPDAVDQYAAALALDPSYRTDQRLIGDVVEALASRRAQARASRIVLDTLGAAALPRLDEATRSASSRKRAQAARLRDRLRQRSAAH